MRYFVAILFILLAVPFKANSQVISKEEMQDLLNNYEIQLENPVIRDFVSMSQIQEDFATTIQYSGLSVEIIQKGDNNIGYVEQIGTGFSTSLSQKGSFNEANLWSEGNNISIEVKQDGDGNTINSCIKNYDLEKLSAMLLQEGNNNRINLALFGVGIPAEELSQEVKITQQGNNHVVEAFMEDSFAPIEITQTPGTNGEGMQVSISNSYFNFPMKK